VLAAAEHAVAVQAAGQAVVETVQHSVAAAAG